jgi:hypothetical protein
MFNFAEDLHKVTWSSHADFAIFDANFVAMSAKIAFRLLTLAVFFIPFLAMGQDSPPFPIGAPDCGDFFGPACIPIDGGVSFLIAAGVALGGKKALDAYRNRE